MRVSIYVRTYEHVVSFKKLLLQFYNSFNASDRSIDRLIVELKRIDKRKSICMRKTTSDDFFHGNSGAYVHVCT